MQRIRTVLVAAVTALAAVAVVAGPGTAAAGQPAATGPVGSWELVSSSSGDAGAPGPWDTGTLVVAESGRMFRMAGGGGADPAPTTVWTAGTYRFHDDVLTQHVERSNSAQLLGTDIEEVVRFDGDTLVLTQDREPTPVVLRFTRQAPHPTDAPAGLTGTYELTSARLVAAGTLPLPGPYDDGVLTYLPDGTMFVMLGRRGTATGPYPTAVWYTGRYDVDRARGVVVHHVLRANVEQREGTDLERPYRLDGDRLVLTDASSVPAPVGPLVPLQLDWARVR